MTKLFTEGDIVEYKDKDWQTKMEEDHPAPFSVNKSEMEDVYSSGFPEDYWEEIVTVQDANGEVCDEVEADDLCKIV
ncbi:hypothetical protein KAU09_03915 [Candidatus Parcubacteria bacterium]|nr:hypothetical protein [Candidatus Parcubacteria bacterium]